MPNLVAKDLELMWESFVEGYDSACVISREAQTSFPDPTKMQRTGDTFYKRQNFQANIVTGLDVAASARTDVIDRFVPTVFRAPDNVLYELDAKEMRDPEYQINMGKAAAIRLAAEIDKNLYAAVAARAGIVVKKVGPVESRDFAQAEALMLSRGIANDRVRKAFLNPFDYTEITKDLGARAFLGDWSKSAYERSQVPDLSSFKTFRTDNMINLAAVGNVSGIAVNGTQSHTVTAMTGDVPTDNRQQVLIVSGANTGNVKAGDAFTVLNVNAVHNIDKSDTGQLSTHRVLATASGGTQLTITPPIIATGPYQNVTGPALNGAALTFLNTVSKPVNAFWADGAVSLDFGNLAFPSGVGADVKTVTTKNGVPLIMSYQFNHLTAKMSVRMTTLYSATVLDPSQCGIIIAGQT